MEKSRSLAALERRLKYSFLNRNLLLTAVTHRSYLHDAAGLGLAHRTTRHWSFSVTPWSGSW